MKIDNSPSPRKPPALIPLCLPSLITSVTTTLSNLSGHSWSPGCIPKLSRMSTNLTQFHTHSLVPFTLSSEPPPQIYICHPLSVCSLPLIAITRLRALPPWQPSQELVILTPQGSPRQHAIYVFSGLLLVSSRPTVLPL